VTADENKKDKSLPHLTQDLGPDVLTLRMIGPWDVSNADKIEHILETLDTPKSKFILIDGSGITNFDTVGAMVTLKMQKALENPRITMKLGKFSPPHESLIEQVTKNYVLYEPFDRKKNTLISVFEDVGVFSVDVVVEFKSFLSFMGLVLARLISCIWVRGRMRLTPLTVQIDQIGFRAIPIVFLISFLIGAVIVSQGSHYLRQFGAEVFAVDMLTVTTLRELGILLTSIIVAGRSGSAFTAQIGSMKVNEEVDAMGTIGMNPIDILVLPRVWGLMIVLPLLTFIADLAGLIGGGLVAWGTLDISPSVFIQRFEGAVSLSTFLLGIVKAPVFGAVIAISGCFQGFSVSGSAESVGKHTTRSVVQSIFLVIVLDAVFAMYFTALGY
jgi:phospholipid/cholesterol/gamma-HCH transport system permease protein